MKQTLFVLAAGALVTALGATAASAQQARCADRARVLDLLENRYGETRRAIGLSAQDTVMEVFASDETGNWTITVTLPSGVTCLVASGHGFEDAGAALPARGAPV